MEYMLQWVIESVGGRGDILSVRPLVGGMSATLHCIEIQLHDRVQTVVLRQFTNKEWLAQQPDLAQHEAESLTWASYVDVPTPQLLAYQETDVPAVLMTLLPGAVELQPADLEEWLEQLAATLVRIHTIPAVGFARQYFPYNDPATLQVPVWSNQKHIWQKALAILQDPRPATPYHLIHRDYHPANVLWQAGRVSGVVDWVNACRGPAGVDVGHCRLNLALLKGVDAADLFLDKYQRLAGAAFAYDPYWDLLAFMEVLPNPPGVYQGWIDLGVTDLDAEMCKQRYEALVASVL